MTVHQEIPVNSKFMVLLPAAVFLGPLAAEAQDVSRGNGFHTVGIVLETVLSSDVLFSPTVGVVSESLSMAVWRGKEGIL